MEAKRRKQILGVAGSIATLAGFISNEQIKEHYKSKLEAVRSAQANFAARADTLSAQEATQIAIRRAAGDASNYTDAEKGNFNQFMESCREDDAMLIALSDELKDNAEQADLKGEVTKELDSLHQTQTNLIAAHNKWSTASHHGMEDANEMKEVFKANFDIIGSDLRISRLKSRISAGLEEQQGRTEKLFERWKVASYAVFGIGWLVTLLAALFGVEAKSE